MRTTKWEFPYAKNKDGTIKLERELTPTQYAEYKEIMEQLYTELQTLAKEKGFDAFVRWTPASVDTKRLKLMWQKCEQCCFTPYPAPNHGERTLASSGQFILVANAMLKYFNKEVTIEELTKLAIYGDWHHEHGTWWHFIDVFGQAYGLTVNRITDFESGIADMSKNKIMLALLDHELFPKSKGNSLVLVTGFVNGKIYFYHPASIELILEDNIGVFMANTKVLWQIGE